ncbi:GNAT family N-acetyltransferase [Microbacteriaceae bacterium 4G12]
MNFIDQAEKLDLAYLSSFTNIEETHWGYLLWNKNQPRYYDANHAHIKNIPQNSQEVINEVVAFYKQIEIIPRFYIYESEKQTAFLSALSSNAFQIEEFTQPVQLWKDIAIPYETNQDIQIERVTDKNFNEALHIECSIHEFGGEEIRKAAFQIEFKHPNYIHYILIYKGIACATACIFHHNKEARLESVATLEAYRGKGLIGHLIHFIQCEVNQMKLQRLWVFPINEKVQKVYERYGFTTIGSFRLAHAFLGGKSIQEIREGVPK